MIHKYVQSVEEYKGFTLSIIMTCLHDYGHFHRSCDVSKNGNRIAVCKTKKEAKDLIDNGCF